MTEMNQISSNEDLNKVAIPLRRVELALNRIIEIGIPFHLKNLEQHKHLIQTYRQNEEWDQLLREEIKASQTVQQLKADVTELDNLSERLMPSDLHIINEKIIPIKTKVCLIVQQFIELHKDLTNPLFCLNENNYQNCSNDKSDDYLKSDEINSNLQIMAEINEQKSSLISWQNLKKELSDLNAMMNSMASALMGQKDKVNRIEDNISTANEDVMVGTQHLSKAAAFKSTLIPVTAALVSGAVFGPIGMLAGFKFSGLASAVGASILGYSGVKFIQKKSITPEEIELISPKDDTNKENSEHKT